MPQPDGTQKAVAILIFPEAMRGVAEGYRPWDLEPNSTMTNATVAEQVAGTDGQTLTVKYKDGDKTILVTPATIIVTYQEVGSERSQGRPENLRRRGEEARRRHAGSAECRLRRCRRMALKHQLSGRVR